MENTLKTTTESILQLPIGQIVPDPDQPRKTFDETALLELSQSIAEHGILVPITVEQKGKKYHIVMGERRYRAAKLIGLEHMPVMVAEFSKEKKREVQIIENLQRQDVEPLEEAAAIGALSDTYKAKDIALKIGRSERFVYSRLKLSQLLKGFHSLVKEKVLPISLAQEVAMLPKNMQEALLSELDGDNARYLIERFLRKEKKPLEKAPFDITDNSLLKGVSACTNCAFNSANSGELFSDGKNICANSPCYVLKRTRQLTILLEGFKNKGIAVISNVRDWNADAAYNVEFLNTLAKLDMPDIRKEGLKIRLKPTKPTLASIKKDYDHIDYSEAELKEIFAEELEEFNTLFAEYKAATKEGYTKAILFDTTDFDCSEVYYTSYKDHTDSQSKERLERKTMDQCTNEEKILKIQHRETRKKHIEANHLFKEALEHISEQGYTAMDKELTPEEMTAFCITLYEDIIGYYNQREFTGFYPKNQSKDHSKAFCRLTKNFNKAHFNRMARMILLSNTHTGETNHTNHFSNVAFYTAVRPYFEEGLAQIEKTYKLEEQKREKRLKERVEKLKD